jgi:hypothetical protein
MRQMIVLLWSIGRITSRKIALAWAGSLAIGMDTLTANCKGLLHMLNSIIHRLRPRFGVVRDTMGGKMLRFIRESLGS